jgi:hypothetical protein
MICDSIRFNNNKLFAILKLPPTDSDIKLLREFRKDIQLDEDNDFVFTILPNQLYRGFLSEPVLITDNFYISMFSDKYNISSPLLRITRSGIITISRIKDYKKEFEPANIYHLSYNNIRKYLNRDETWYSECSCRIDKHLYKDIRGIVEAYL